MVDDLATYRSHLASFLYQAGKLDGSITEIKEARAIVEPLFETNERHPGYRQLLSELWNHLGNALHKRDDAKGAVEAHRKALALHAEGDEPGTHYRFHLLAV